jgi:predicted acetyltransferase
VELPIRHVSADELPAFVEVLRTAFLDMHIDPARVAPDLETIWDLDRTLAAFHGDRVVSTFRSFPTELTVPGNATLPAAAIAAVTVLPGYRRRGLLRRMIGLDEAAARDRGDAVGLLYAAEWGIYGRFGYGPGCRLATWTVDTVRAAFPDVEPAGSVEIADVGPTARDAMAAVFDAWRRRQPGEIGRMPHRWDFALSLRTTAWGEPWHGFLALHRDTAGAVDGYAQYHAETYVENGVQWNRILVDELHALTEPATADLWRFLVTMDLVGSVRARGRRLSDPLPWLLIDGRAARLVDVGDGMWVRLIDVPRALTARTYERSAAVVLEVADEALAGGRARFALDAGPEGSTCTPTDRSADLTLHVSALGAAYLGGTRLRDAVRVRGVDEHRPGALAEADALFATPDEPWCTTFF